LIAAQFSPRRVVAMDLVPVAAPGVNGRGVSVRVVGGDCFRLPFRDQSFDVVLGSLILHRFRALEDVLGEVQRVLSPGGTYLGIEPSLLNPLHLFRHAWADHSPNEFLLGRRRLRAAFAATGFRMSLVRLSPRAPRLATVGLATCLGIIAGTTR
jgi:SAM-dependent methyltransferase